MINPENLLKVIDADLQVCRGTAQRLNEQNDTKGEERSVLEFNTLMVHLQWARRAGTDQAELEHVVHSLETSELLGGYQHWRERSEIKSCPDHKELMRYPTSITLPGGDVITNLYYCPVDRCDWRYSTDLGDYKKATNF